MEDKTKKQDESKLLNIADIMAMFPIVYLSKVNRVEVIDEKGRSYVNCKPTNRTELQLQDNGKTLKIIIFQVSNP